MVEALPNATLEVLPGRGHAIHIERPRRLAAALQRIRRSQVPRPTLKTAGSPASI